MSSTLIVKDTHPRKPFHIIAHIGLQALNLATTHQIVIEERVPGVTNALALSLDTLGVAIPGTIQTRSESVAMTAEQRDRVQQGYIRVQAVRMTVQMAGVTKGIQRAYGVGRKVVPTLHTSVAAALQLIVDRANEAPQEAAALGLGPVAMAGLTSFLASLHAMDQAQDKTRAAAPLSTKERNIAAHRVLQTVALIAGAGMLHFADDPTTHANFQALVRRPKRRPSASKKRSASVEPTNTVSNAVQAGSEGTNAAVG